MEPMDPRFAEYERRGLTWQRAMDHARLLAQEAEERLRTQPDAQLVAVILAPDASEIRDQVEALIRAGRAKAGDWVPLLIDRPQVVGMLRANAPHLLEHLPPDQHGGARQLPVLVVTSFGMRVGAEPLGMGARPGRRVPCTVHAMLLCNDAVQQAGSLKWSVLGTHDTVRVPQVPYPHRFAVYVCLGDFATGNTLELVVRSDGEQLFHAQAQAWSTAERGPLHMGLRVPMLLLPRLGRYAVELRSGGAVLATRWLTVTTVAS